MARRNTTARKTRKASGGKSATRRKAPARSKTVRSKTAQPKTRARAKAGTKARAKTAKPRAKATARRRAKAAAKPRGFYHIEVQPKEAFVEFKSQDIGRDGGIERIAGKRAGGSWSTQEWLIAKNQAHIERGTLVGDTVDARRGADNAWLGAPAHQGRPLHHPRPHRHAGGHRPDPGAAPGRSRQCPGAAERAQVGLSHGERA